ncbi:hypothetical protein AMR42_02030 [Limnothrix sp. PR1529]|nr:hypothetical protein BCR12_00905 [Limnothrix sp. P13C2]PIB15289.1 hypothetical protein AMR42_02030 [Limnothrix sp. PR1529]
MIKGTASQLDADLGRIKRWIDKGLLATQTRSRGEPLNLPSRDNDFRIQHGISSLESTVLDPFQISFHGYILNRLIHLGLIRSNWTCAIWD